MVVLEAGNSKSLAPSPVESLVSVRLMAEKWRASAHLEKKQDTRAAF
jgi:hypothetical protein